MKRKLLLAGVLIGMAVTFAACSSKSAGSTTTTAASSASSTTGAPATTAAPTSTTAGQTMTVTPSTGLTNLQLVTISGTGFPAGYSLGVTECADAGAKTTAGDCDLSTIVIAKTNAQGDVVGYKYHPALGPFGQDNIVCTKAPGCILSLATAGSPNPKYDVTAKISFS